MEIQSPDIATFAKIKDDLEDLLMWKGGKILKMNFGWEEYKAIGFRDTDYKKMFKDLGALGPIEIVEKKMLPERSMRDTFAITLSTVFSELTEKQIESLLMALDYGYYKIPKQITAEEIAGKSHFARTTYEQHLRKAESKILQAISPYVRMYGFKRALEAPSPLLAK